MSNPSPFPTLLPRHFLNLTRTRLPAFEMGTAVRIQEPSNQGRMGVLLCSSSSSRGGPELGGRKENVS